MMCTGGGLLFHGAHLHRRRVRAQQHAVGDEEGVVQGTGRVIGRRVESLEVVVLGLDLGPFGDLVAHADEDVLDLPLGLIDQVQPPEGRRPTGQGDVHALPVQDVQQLIGLDDHPALFERGLERLADDVAELAQFRPLLRRQLGDAAQQHGEIGFAAEKAYARLFDRSQVRRGRDGRHALGVDGPQIGPRHLLEDRVLSTYGSSFQAVSPEERPRDVRIRPPKSDAYRLNSYARTVPAIATLSESKRR